jgi:predicted Zn-dependent protease
MKEQRLQQLKAFLAESPNDPFLLHAIACEYMAESPNEAWRYFEQLLESHPAYVPTYYQAAATLVSLGEIERAKNVYEEGIRQSKLQGEQRAWRELQQAYQQLLFEEE